jgi:Family of unknown function (DUF6515)
MKSTLRILTLLLFTLLLVSNDALAQRRGGGGAHRSRGAARTSISGRAHPAVRPTPAARPNVDRTNVARRDVDRRVVDRDVDVNRAIDVDRDVDIDISGRDYDYNDWGCCHHPVAAAAVTAAAVATTAAAVGSMIYTLPTYCSTTVVNGVTYEQCGDTWYQPQFYGSDAAYIVVTSPQ